MRVDLRGPLTSARPTRGALVATLFAVIMIALVAGYSLSTDDDESVALDTESSDAISATPDPADSPTTTSAPADADADDSDGEDTDVADRDRSDLRAVNYALSLDDIGDADDALSFADGDSSGSAADAPASPTTQPPEPAAQTTVIDLSGSSTSVVDDGTETTAADTTDTTAAGAEAGDTTTSDTSETTAPAETTTTAAPSAHPEGYVDAGHGVFVPPVLIEIRRCESTHNYQAANPSSTARGAYQFLRSSWAAYGHADRYGVAEAHLATNAQQDEAALITWQRDGTRPWNASRSCWG